MEASSSSTSLSAIQAPSPLVVEDSRVQREQLVETLKRAGIFARQAADSEEALSEASSAPVGVVLMDHILNDKMDGIDLAREIQCLHPHSAVIFVTGQDPKKIDWARIHQLRVHVEGIIEKPVLYRLQELLRLIEKAQVKVRIREILENAVTRRLDPVTYLQALADLEPSLPAEIVPELLAELRPDEGGVADITTEIDQVYDQIRELVETRPGSPELPLLLQPLRERLDLLEESEADAMERRYRARLEFDSAEGERLLERAARLLGDL